MAEKLTKIKEQVYEDPRPKEYFDKFHRRAREREPNWVHEVVRVLTGVWGLVLNRMRCIGAKNVWKRGAMIIAPNHFSWFDHFYTGSFTPRRVRFMGKSQIFKGPMAWIFSTGGVFPVRRGHQDEETFITARTILRKGRAVVMYCEGGRSRTGKLSETAKRGLGRIALESGAPVVPVAIYGSHRVRNWKRLQFPKVTVEYGQPMHFPQIDNPTREAQQEVADEVHAEIKRLYAGLEQRKGRRKSRR
jgi:1-acyl-sn-glycerol-3-phosphate acyltransferase